MITIQNTVAIYKSKTLWQEKPEYFDHFELEYIVSASVLIKSRLSKSCWTKHMGLPYHWIRSKVSSLEIDIDIQAVFSADQLADQFTKGLVKKRCIVQQSSFWDGDYKKT